MKQNDSVLSHLVLFLAQTLFW